MFGIDLAWRRVTIHRSMILMVQKFWDLLELWDIFHVVTLLDDPIVFYLVFEIPQVSQVRVSLVASSGHTLCLNMLNVSTCLEVGSRCFYKLIVFACMLWFNRAVFAPSAAH